MATRRTASASGDKPERKKAKSEAQLIEVAGREVSLSNPDKVLFPQPGYTKRDLVRYYLAVAEGALRGAGNRPNVLVRYPNGIAGEFFYQKRAPTSRPPWVEVVSLKFPSGRSAEEVVPRNAATLAWMANLACLELHPHPVRADDLDHPDELRVDLDPVPGVAWAQVREVALVARATLHDHGLVGWPKTSGSRGMHIVVRIEHRWTFDQVRRARWRWRGRSNAGHPSSPPANGGRKNVTACSSTTIRTPRTARCPRPIRCGRRPTPGCRRRSTGRRSRPAIPHDFTLATMPARFAKLGDRHRGIDEAAGSLEPLLELSERHEKEGLGDAPWPPHFRKQEGEPAGVGNPRSAARRNFR